MLGNIFKVFHTVKYLRPQQIAGQVVNRVRSRFSNPARLLNQSIPAAGQCCWPEGIDILPPGLQANCESDILKGQLTFLNSTQEVGWMPDWQSGELPKLWFYNLHYFEWLWALGYDHAKMAVSDWIKNHPPAKGQQGWEPYPISLRVINICGVFFAKYRSEIEADEEFRNMLWKSIYLKVEWLMSHLETHLLGNHYLENGAALAFVGTCFDGPAAARWLSKGSKILESEIPEQVLPDGMHFELSPMYHSRMLYLLLILRAANHARIRDLVDEPIARMASALKNLCHPDEQISLFNDSAFGIYNDPKQLLQYAVLVGRRDVDSTEHDGQKGGQDTNAASGLLSRHDGDGAMGAFSLPDSGYYGWRDECGNYVILDAGHVGPDYQPGHAHADFGSYELSLNGKRVIVDSGVHDYENSELRRYSRSTAAHNTVEIDETDQSEIWGTFRVARRAVPKDVVWKPSETGFILSGRHTGYERLPRKPKHTRSIQWDVEQIALSVSDTITAQNSVRSISRIHLHPECSIKDQGNQSLLVEYSKGEFEIAFQGASEVSIESGWYFPEFGKKIKNTVIELRVEGVKGELHYEVRALNPV